VDLVLAPPIRRTVYAVLTTALLATIVAAVVAWGTGYCNSPRS